MIRYLHRKPRILFVGINPHPGSYARGVPFSNNKMFWYLLSEAGLIGETRVALGDDAALKRMYETRFNAVYGLGLLNVVDRPTRDVSGLNRGEESPGRNRIARAIRTQKPAVVCFIGKVAYARFKGSSEVSFGWQEDMGGAKVFVMHFPLRGKAAVRVRELRRIARAARVRQCRSTCRSSVPLDSAR
jgi:TDG/mug DNA glycosylase family protein